MTISNLSSRGLTSSGYAGASQRKSTTSETTAAGAQQALALQSLGATSSAGRGAPPPPPLDVSSGAKSSMAAMLNVQALDRAEVQSDSPSADFGATLQSMLEAIASGDTETAQEAAGEITTMLSAVEADTASSTEDPGAMQFLADVKALASAVQSGSESDLESSLTTLSEGFAAGAAQAPMGPPPGPPPTGGPGGELMSGISDLLSAIDEGDTEATSAAAETLQSMLDEIAAQTDGTAETRGGLETDLQTLLDAVESGDKTNIASAADTLTAGLSRAAEGAPPPMGSQPSEQAGTRASSAAASTLQTSLETALDTLSQILTASGSGDTSAASSSETETASGQTAFLNSLKTLFEALSTGTGVDERVKAVVAAYSETSATAAS